MKRAGRWRLVCAAILGVSLMTCGVVPQGGMETIVSYASSANSESPFESETTVETKASAGLEVATDAAAPALYRYEATKESSFKGDLTELFNWDTMPARTNGNERYVIGFDGKNILDDPLSQVEPLAGDAFAVWTTQPGPNNMSVVSLSKGNLTREAAAYAKMALSKKHEGRFVVVCYATEQTNVKEEAFAFEHDYDETTTYCNEYSYDSKAQYKGYFKVLDTQERAFLDGVKITNPKAVIWEVDDSVLIVDEGISTLYDAMGKELWREATYAEAGAHSFCYEKGDVNFICDASGKELFTTDSWLSAIDGPNDYYSCRRGDVDEIIGSDGRHIASFQGVSVFDEADGLFSVGQTGDSSNAPWHLIDLSAKTIARGSMGRPRVEGYIDIFNKEMADNCYSLTSGGEVLAAGLDGTAAQNLVITDTAGNYYVFKDHKCSLWLGDSNVLGPALVGGRAEASAMYGAYDLFTGESIIPTDKYSGVLAAGDHILAYSGEDGVWDVYAVKRIPLAATAS